MAETRGTVLIVRVPHDGPVVARIRAELEANELVVRELGPDADSARKPLPELAADVRARAALRMQSQRAVELWVGGETGTAAGSGEVVSTDAERDDALLALRATEALRARGLRLSRPAAPPPPPRAAEGDRADASAGAATAATPAPDRSRGDSSPGVAVAAGAATRAEPTPEAKPASAARPATAEPARVQQPAAATTAASAARPQPKAAKPQPSDAAADEQAAGERAAPSAPEDDTETADEEAAESEPSTASARPSGPKPLLAAEVGPALSVSPGHVHPSYAGWVNLRMQPSDRWSIAAFGVLPFAGGGVENAGQSASLRNYIAGGLLELHWPLAAFEISAGAGAAVVFTYWYAEQVASTDFVKKEGVEVTGSVLARAGASLALSDDVRLGARVSVGLSVPPIKVKFPEPEGTVAHWGQPYFVFTLGVEIGLPGLVR